MQEDIDGRTNEPFFSGEVGPDDSGAESEDWSGRRLGHYRIRRELGHGSMGVVYLAEDMRLCRLVAIKSLTVRLRKYPDAIEQIRHEAQLLAQLNHSGVSIIYDILEHDGDTYLILEYVPGRTLAELMSGGSRTVLETIATGIQIANAVSAAHAMGIVHRDLKPSNMKVTDEGAVKVLDFGIGLTPAKNAAASPSAGTPAYMSPEQVRGEAVDAQSDVWSLGCILYEMVTARHPFARAARQETFAAVLQAEPDWSAFPPDMLPELRAIIAKCIAKEKLARYRTAEQLAADLRRCHEMLTSSAVNARVLWRRVRRPRVAAAIFCLFVIIAVLASCAIYRAQRIRWAHTQALPEVSQLIEQQHYCKAFHLAGQAQDWIAGDSLLVQLWPRMAKPNFRLLTSPSRARVAYREYGDVDAPWRSLGLSPVEQTWFPFGVYRLLIEKDGCAPVERLIWNLHHRLDYKHLPEQIVLHSYEEIPPDMVYVPPLLVPAADWWFTTQKQRWTGAFFIDRYEVSNRQYHQFVTAGGYASKSFWEHSFIKDGREITWQQAQDFFRDSTGRPGPANWQYGIYPTGQGDLPVTGISWYEACAYARYRQKVLPTIYHWIAAAMPLQTSTYTIARSNFSAAGIRPVDGTEAMNVFGSYDMAGNAAEWCFNARDDSPDQRYVLGGAWDQPDFMFYTPACNDAFERPDNTGFRCIRCLPEEDLERTWGVLSAPTLVNQRNLHAPHPLPERDFRLLTRGLFAYDRQAPFNAEIALAQPVSPPCRMERVTIDAAYDGQRMDVLMYLPDSASFKPPYQAVVIFPTGSALIRRSSSDIPADWLHLYLVRSGRVVVMPVYNGMWERGPLPYEWNWTISSLPVFEWAKDWMRTADYIRTRQDIDKARIAFFGYSLGGVAGVFMSGAEELPFHACVLRAGGIPIYEEPPPERDPVHYLPRITIPMLMINGKNDWLLPFDASIRPMFDLIGTPPAAKRLAAVYEGHHGIPEDRLEREIIRFLDQYFGAPQNIAP